jgi:hypothetical protein
MADKTLGAILTLCGGVLLAHFPSYYQSEVMFEANAISANGIVVKMWVESEYSGGGLAPLTARTEYVSRVNFHTRQGELTSFTTSNACSSQEGCVGKIVQMQYDPSTPKLGGMWYFA